MGINRRAFIRGKVVSLRSGGRGQEKARRPKIPVEYWSEDAPPEK
jgi:hypothetical protein